MVCACSERNNVNHAMICQLGEYIHLRHINLRDTAAELQRSNEICKDDVRCLESCPIWCTFGAPFTSVLVITDTERKCASKREPNQARFATSDISLRMWKQNLVSFQFLVKYSFLRQRHWKMLNLMYVLETSEYR